MPSSLNDFRRSKLFRAAVIVPILIALIFSLFNLLFLSFFVLLFCLLPWILVLDHNARSHLYCLNRINPQDQPKIQVDRQHVA